MPSFKLPRLKECKTRNCTAYGISVDGRCIQHTTFNEPVYTNNHVASLKNPIGVELECSAPRAIRHITEILATDGSVNGGAEQYGYEIKAVDEHTRIGVKSADLARKAKILGSRVNRSCGFHVHMSFPGNPSISESYYDMKSEYKYKLFPIISAIQEEVFSLFSSRANNHYCFKIRRESDMSDHSAWINVGYSRPTTEIKIHSGTLSPAKITSWTQVCVGLQKMFHDVYYEKETLAVKKAKNGDFIKMFRSGTIARKYLEARKASEGRLRRYRL